MNIKKLKIISTIIAFLMCFPLHFLYDLFPCFFTSIFSPVNESIWEHMKLLFGSIMLTGVFQKIYINVKHKSVNNVCISNFLGALLAIPIFLILFLPIYNIIGENMFVAILIMFITIVIVEIISYFIMKKEPLKLEYITVLFAIAMYILFGILTYYPLKNDLFMDPKTHSYGVSDK